MMQALIPGGIRHVPFSTKVTLLYGDFLAMFGWIFFGVGMLFTWIFVWPMIALPLGLPAHLAPHVDNEAGVFILFVLLFPIIGGACLAHGFVQGKRKVRILQSGHRTMAQYVSEQPTSTSINNAPVIAYTFQFEGVDGLQHEATVRTHRGGFLKQGETYDLLYDPQRPHLALLLDLLPNNTKLTAYGTVTAADGAWWLHLLAPTLSFLTQAGLLYAQLFGV